jgi:hypothetical protein
VSKPKLQGKLWQNFPKLILILALCKSCVCSDKLNMLHWGVLLVLAALVGKANCILVDSHAQLLQIEANQRPVGLDWQRDWHILHANHFTSCMLNHHVGNNGWFLPEDAHNILPALEALFPWDKPQWQDWALAFHNKVFQPGQASLLMNFIPLQQHHPQAPNMPYQLHVPVWQRMNHPDQWVSRCMVVDPSRLSRFDANGHLVGEAGFSLLHTNYIQHYLSSLSNDPLAHLIREQLHRLVCFIWRGASPLAAAGVGMVAAGRGIAARRGRGRPHGPRSKHLVRRVGMVAHLCGVHNCVNPLHVCWVSSSDNARMMHYHRQPGNIGKLWVAAVGGGMYLQPMQGPNPR